VEIDDRALRQIRRFDHQAQRRVFAFLRERIAIDEDPRRIGHPLTGVGTGLWRYRVGNYRIVCRIEDDRVVVLVVAVGHRSDVYR
jgi:mRNA interferase RelE/StbE